MHATLPGLRAILTISFSVPENTKPGVLAGFGDYSQSAGPNHFKVSAEKHELEDGEEEESEEEEDDDDDGFPVFEGYVKTFNNSIEIRIVFIIIFI